MLRACLGDGIHSGCSNQPLFAQGSEYRPGPRPSHAHKLRLQVRRNPSRPAELPSHSLPPSRPALPPPLGPISRQAIPT